jgi:hypothetical protein
MSLSRATNPPMPSDRKTAYSTSTSVLIVIGRSNPAIVVRVKTGHMQEQQFAT